MTQPTDPGDICTRILEERVRTNQYRLPLSVVHLCVTASLPTSMLLGMAEHMMREGSATADEAERMLKIFMLIWDRPDLSEADIAWERFLDEVVGPNDDRDPHAGAAMSA